MGEQTNTPPADAPPADSPPPAFVDTIREHIPEEFADRPYWNQIPDMPTFVKNYAEHMQYRGQSVRIPGDDATEEQRAAFYKKLGRPDEPKGYQLDGVEGADKLPQETIDWFKQVAFDEGVPQKAFTNIMSKYASLMEKGNEDKDEQLRAETAKMAEFMKRPDQWGANYDRNMAYAKRAMARMGADDETLRKIEESGLGNDPNFLNMFYRTGRQMAEHGMIAAEVEGVPDKQSALVKIGELKARDEYWDAKKPGHKELVDEVQRLTQLAYE